MIPTLILPRNLPLVSSFATRGYQPTTINHRRHFTALTPTRALQLTVLNPPARTTAKPSTNPFFEKATSSWQYVVADPVILEAVIIDPVLDYDHSSGNVTTTTADGLFDFIKQNKMNVVRILSVHSKCRSCHL